MLSCDESGLVLLQGAANHPAVFHHSGFPGRDLCCGEISVQLLTDCVGDVICPGLTELESKLINKLYIPALVLADPRVDSSSGRARTPEPDNGGHEFRATEVQPPAKGNEVKGRGLQMSVPGPGS